MNIIHKFLVTSLACICCFGASASDLVGRYATIPMDGTLSGWLPSDTLYQSSEITAGAPLNATFTNVLVANDSDYVYVVLQVPAPNGAITNTRTYNLYLDTDMNPATGFNSGWMTWGYDHLVEYGQSGTTYSVYSFGGGADQTDWNWNWLGLMTYAYSDSLVEWAIPISMLGLTTNQMRMEFSVTGGDVTTETWASQYESGASAYTLASPPNTTTNQPRTITIDGSFDDWAGLTPLFSNPQGSTNATDFKDVYVCNDANYIYFRVTLWEPSDLLSWENNIFMNTDNNSSTGYQSGWGGSEMLIQSGVGYQEKNGNFNDDSGINGLNWLSADAGSTNYEFRVSLAATYASDGLPVFTTNVIHFAFDGESNFTTVNRMPAGTGTIAYTLASYPGPLTIGSSGGQVTITWPGSATLQACGDLAGGSWTNVPAATSPYVISNPTGQLYFRLVQ